MTSKLIALSGDDQLGPDIAPEADALRVISGDNLASPTDTAASASGELPIAQRLDENLDEASPDDAIQANPQWGSVSMLAAIQSLGGIIPGAGIIEAAFSNTFRTVEMHGDFSISNGGGSLESYFLEQSGIVDAEGRKKGDDDSDPVGSYMEAAEQRAERKREMEEWQRTEHEYAGVTMTGEEWGSLAKDLSKGGKLRQWLLAKIKKNENATDAEAESLADKVALRTKMNDVPPDQWTDEMKQLDKEMRADPELKAKVDGYVRKSAQQRSASYGVSTAIDSTVMDEDRGVSVATRADVLDANPLTRPSHSARASAGVEPFSRSSAAMNSGAAGDVANGDFPSAPDLTAHHQAAVAAVEPLDASKPSTRIASAPAPANAAGLDV